MRRIIGVLIAVALGMGVFALWPRAANGPSSTTVAAAAPTTVTTQPESTTTAVPDPTTTTSPESHVVETVQEAEEILRELWFGWFEGIYNEDEDRIREVVASAHQVALAVDQFDNMTFANEPAPTDITYSDTEVLLATEGCTVVFTHATFDGFTSGTTTDVHILRWADGWKIFSLWAFPDDLWEGDCEAELS